VSQSHHSRKEASKVGGRQRKAKKQEGVDMLDILRRRELDRKQFGKSDSKEEDKVVIC